MTQHADSIAKIARLVELLKEAGGLRIDVEMSETRPDDPSTAATLFINLSGDDADLFIRDDLELLRALHHVAAAMLGLGPDEQDSLWFDVRHLRSERMGELRLAAEEAEEYVRNTLRPHFFAPMPSCERHMLHRVLATSGMKYASVGEGKQRCVVLYPEADSAGRTPESGMKMDAEAWRNAS